MTAIITPLMAHARAAQKAKRPKAFKLEDHDLCKAIENWMDDGWSAKLIAEVLARDHPDDRLARVSHETIYQCLYVQGRGQLRADLNKCLSTKRAARKIARTVTERRGKFSDVITISQRPAVVDDRAVPGHWEGDLILGTDAPARSAPWLNAAPDSPFCYTSRTTTPPTRWPPR